jgi:hypothetical protein
MSLNQPSSYRRWNSSMAAIDSTDALIAEPGPDLAVALAVERRLGQVAADVAYKLLVGATALRATPLGLALLLDGHALLAAVMPSSRPRSSILSPRTRRKKVAASRGAGKRPRLPGFVVFDMGVGS